MKNRSLIFCILALIVAQCAKEETGISPEQWLALAAKKPSFEEFRARTYHEDFEDGVYIVDGDIPIQDDTALLEYYNHLEETPSREQLIINRYRGRDDVWNARQKNNITFCVSALFGARKSQVVRALSQAASEWEKAADVNFVHVSAQDAKCDQKNTAVVFDVRPVKSGQYLARSFFPSEGRKNSNLLIDDSSFEDSGYTLKGILAHELGHVLGFRHEHTRPEAHACFEDKSWRPLTPYDPSSVMHYPQCNGEGKNLKLTDLDRLGAADVYGPPK